MVREGRVLISSAGDPDFGASYSVQVLEIGAQVTSGSSGTTITVRAGHGFAVGDKVMIGTDVTTFSATNTVASVTSTTVVMNSAYAVSAGDLLVNLAVDSSTAATPAFDGAGLTVYSDMAYGSSANNNTVSTDANGRYRYYHKGIARWELVRTGDTLISLYTDTDAASASVYNVKDYGASGDGVADDTVAIQSALTAVPSTGGKVYIPAGTYIVSDAGWIKSNTHVYGDGIDVTILKRKANSLSATSNPNNSRNRILTTGSAYDTPYTNASPGASITLSDMTLDNNYANQSLTAIANGAHCFGVAHTIGTDTGGCIDGLTIQRVKAQNSMQDGLYVQNCRNVLIDSCVLYKVGQTTAVTSKNGISITGGPTEITNGWNRQSVVTNNLVSYSGEAVVGASTGIATNNQNDVTISDNDIGYGAQYGIELGVSDAAVVNYGYTITGNTIHDHTITAALGGIGIACSPTGAFKSVVVSGNTITNTYWNGMYLGKISGLTVSDNVLYNTNTDGSNATYLTAIQLITCDAVSASGNVVLFGTAAAGVYGFILSAVTNGAVVGNTVKTPLVACYLLSASSQDVLVTGNRGVGGTLGVRIGPTGTNSGNVVWSNYMSGQSSAAYQDSSGQTNYMDNLAAGAMTIPGVLTVNGNSTFGDASTDTYTFTGRMIVRTITADPTGSATVGTIGEIVYASTPNKFYGKHTTSASDTNWRLMGT